MGEGDDRIRPTYGSSILFVREDNDGAGRSLMLPLLFLLRALVHGPVDGPGDAGELGPRPGAGLRRLLALRTQGAVLHVRHPAVDSALRAADRHVPPTDSEATTWLELVHVCMKACAKALCRLLLRFSDICSFKTCPCKKEASPLQKDKTTLFQLLLLNY